MIAAELDRPSLIGLRGIAILQGLDDEVLQEVARACRFQRVRARQTVMSRADTDRDCCLVLSGRLRVVALSPGGETLGEMAALDGRPRSATVVALQESLLARISPADLQTLMRNHWPVCERLLLHLARAVRALTERVYELSTLSVQQRLCAELLRLALAGEGAAGERVVLHGLPSHKELAARIGTSREQVTRELGELLRLGLLQHEGPERLVIEGLSRLARRIEALHVPT
jgi:CRP/FNR family transcriptional regulator, cyclic AMP receptor protein